MSYVLTAYVLDLADLKSVIGSKDKSIIRKIEPMIEESFGDDEEEAEAQRAAVRSLVMGEPLDPDNNQYGHALWNICRVKGDEFLPDAWGGIRWDSVEACGLEDLLTKTGSPIALPLSDDFPNIGYIKRDMVGKYIEAAEEQKKKSNPDVIGLLDEYLGWLKNARARNKDIILFYS